MTKPELFERLKKIRWKAAGIGLITVLATATLNYWIIFSTQSRVFTTIDDLPANQVGLLLGATPRRGRRLSPFFLGRIDAAARLYHGGKVKHLLVSGDGEADEPAEMKKELLKRGVPESAMTLDDACFRTLDSVARAKEVFGLTELTVITDDFHTYRALFLCRKYGINAVAFSSFAGSVRPIPFLASTMMVVREWLARVKAVLDIYILHTDPTTVGPRIEIKV